MVVTFLQYFKGAIPLSLASIISDGKSAVSYYWSFEIKSLSLPYPSSPHTFNFFSLSLIFINLTVIYFSVVCIVLILFGDDRDYWVEELKYFISFENFQLPYIWMLIISYSLFYFWDSNHKKCETSLMHFMCSNKLPVFSIFLYDFT